MRNVSLQEACQALGVTSSSLNRWLKRAKIEPQRDPVDQRKHFISLAQLQHIARLHGVPLHPTYGAGVTQQASSNIDMPFFGSVEGKRPLQEMANETDTIKRLEDISSRLFEIERKLEMILDSAQPKRDTPQVERNVTQDTSVPIGAVAMRTFATAHGISKDYLRHRIEAGQLEAVSVPYRGKRQFRFTVEQVPEVIRYLREHGIAYEQCSDVRCACHG